MAKYTKGEQINYIDNKGHKIPVIVNEITSQHVSVSPLTRRDQHWKIKLGQLSKRLQHNLTDEDFDLGEIID